MIRPDDCADPRTAALLIRQSAALDMPTAVEHVLEGTRKRAERIKLKMSTLKSDFARDIFLLQQFLIDSLADYKKHIAKRYFPISAVERPRADDALSRYLAGSSGSAANNSAARATLSKYERWFFRALFVLYALFIVLFVYLYGLTIGSLGTTVWLQIAFISLFIDIFYLIPLKIWVRRVGIVSAVNLDVRVLHGLLRERAKAILMRRAGLMRNSNALVQHFNPACRAARAFAHLPSARLLMSLNDFDIPLDYSVSISRSKRKSMQVNYAEALQ
jgi:hypothetical protein